MCSDGASTLLWHFLWYYIDDDAVGSDTVVCHIFVMQVVFIRFLRYGLRIRLAKCEFIMQGAR